MTLRRMDNVLIVVDDLEAVKAFFLELGMELEGQVQMEGDHIDRLVGLEVIAQPSPDLRGRLFR